MPMPDQVSRLVFSSILEKMSQAAEYRTMQCLTRLTCKLPTDLQTHRLKGLQTYRLTIS